MQDDVGNSGRAVNRFQRHTANAPFLLLHITYSRDGGNFLSHRQNSCWVIISFILMTSLTERALMLQGEI